MIGLGLTLGLGRTGGPSYPPADTILSALNANGWQATILDPSGFSGPIKFGSERGGFDSNGNATTYKEPVALTARIFNAWNGETAYNQATLNPTQGALSDFVYKSDTLSVLNTASLPDSPKPIIQWLTVDRCRVTDTLTVEYRVNHRDGVACTELRATDGSTTVSAKSATQVISPRSTDVNPVSCYRVTLDISGLADPATIEVNIKAWPRLGGASSVADTADLAATNANRRLASPRFFRRSTAARPIVAVVDASSGGGSATPYVGTDEAAALASPATNLSTALSRALVVLGDLGGLRVLLQGRAVNSANAPTTLPAITPIEEITIEPAPGVPQSAAIVEWGAANVGFRVPFVRHKGTTFNRVGGLGAIAPSATGHVVFENFTFNNSGVTSSLSTLTGSGSYFDGGTITGMSGAAFGAQSSHEIRMMRGVTGTPQTAGTAYQLEMFNVHGSRFTDVTGNNAAARNQSGRTMSSSEFYGDARLEINGGGDVVGSWFENIVSEFTSSTSNTGLAVSHDTQTINTTHVGIVHCTFAGYYNWGRNNLFYNDTASLFRTHTLHRDWGNIYVSLNTKHDFFAGITGVAGDASLRTGGWSYQWGTGAGYNWVRYRDANGNWKKHYPGEGSVVGTATTGLGLDPLFVNYRGANDNGAGGATAGLGGGNYRLQAGSPCRNLAPVKPWTPPFGLDGTARSGTVQLGAYAA